jgi:hypothetical protein
LNLSFSLIWLFGIRPIYFEWFLVSTFICNVLQLQEIGDFYPDAFAEKNFSYITNFSAEQDAANFL